MGALRGKSRRGTKAPGPKTIRFPAQRFYIRSGTRSQTGSIQDYLGKCERKMSATNPPTTDVEVPDAQQNDIASAIDKLVAKAQKALDAYSAFTQEDVDHLVKKASVAALNQHGELAVLAVKETGRGVFEDKA